MFADNTQKRRIQMQRTYQGIVPGWFSPTRGGDMWARFNAWRAYQAATGRSTGGLDSRDPQIQAWVRQGRYDISPNGQSLIDLWQPASATVAPVSVQPATPPIVVRPPLPPGGGGGGNSGGGTLPNGAPVPKITIQDPVVTPATPTPSPTGVPVTTNKPGWKPGDWMY